MSIKRDFHPGGLTGEVRPQASVLTVLEGVGAWQQQAPRNRSVTIGIEGLAVKVKATSQPTLASFSVSFLTPEPAANVVNILDHMIGVGADHPDKGPFLHFEGHV